MSKKRASKSTPQSIRVLHFADVHIGMENYGRTDPQTGLSSRVVDFLRRLDEMVATAREQGVDLVIFAGDAFKTRSPEPTFQREFAWRVRDLATLAPVVLLVGNHDLPPNAVKASSVEIYNTLDVPNVIVAQDYDLLTIETARGRVLVGTAPYPIRARLLQALPAAARSIREVDELLEQTLSDLLDGLAARADELDPDDKTPRLLTGHFTVRGARLGSERSVMLGRDVQISLGLVADPRWDYVALGHIHKYQNLTADREGAPPVVYSGSLERIDFGEEGDEKGYCRVDLARHNTTYDFVPVAARPMVTLRADCRQDDDPTRTLRQLISQHDLSEAIVRLIVQLTPETDARLNDVALRDALRRAGAFHVAGMRREIERPQRARLGTNPERFTPEELLDQYLRSRDDLSPDRRAALLEAGRAIIQGEDSASSDG